MNFHLEAMSEKKEESLYFIFYKDKLLVISHNETTIIPTLINLHRFKIDILKEQYIGALNNINCFVSEIPSMNLASTNVKFIDLRSLYGLVDEDLFWAAARAYHLMNWNRNTQFCGRCGAKTKATIEEHAKVCTQCNTVIYPKISPAIIVAITHEDKILLAQNSRSKNKFYSVLAGFVEAGETLEECVIREVKEEVGIDIKNIRYFGSQPWPFPDSLMVGFTAEYAMGDLCIDEKELSDARWFTVDTLPEIPGSISISRDLINWFINNNS